MSGPTSARAHPSSANGGTTVAVERTPNRGDVVPYVVEFAASVTAHTRALTARERATVLRAVERRLAHEPLVETRNRKPLRPNPVAPWELRVGRPRVFYEVTPILRVVRVLAVGKKTGNVLRIGGKKVRL